VTSQGTRQSSLFECPFICLKMRMERFPLIAFSIIFRPNTLPGAREEGNIVANTVSHILKCKSYCLLNYRQLSELVLGSRFYVYSQLKGLV
jgi:hypothetical protein